MLDWVYTFPDIVIVAAAVVVICLAIVTLPGITGRIPMLAPNAANTDFVLRIQGTLFTMTAFALAFTLVQAQANIRRIEAMCASEASNINSLDRLLARYGSPEAANIRPKLRAYAESIVRDEWPAMARGVDSPPTGSLFAPVVRAIAAIHPEPGRQATFYAEMLKLVEEIAEGREARLDAVTVALPTIYWVIIAVAMSVLVIASCAIERTPSRTFFLCAQAAVLTTFVAVVFITDQPFKGQTSVTPDSLTKVLATMTSRQN